MRDLLGLLGILGFTASLIGITAISVQRDLDREKERAAAEHPSNPNHNL